MIDLIIIPLLLLVVAVIVTRYYVHASSSRLPSHPFIAAASSSPSHHALSDDGYPMVMPSSCHHSPDDVMPTTAWSPSPSPLPAEPPVVAGAHLPVFMIARADGDNAVTIPMFIYNERLTSTAVDTGSGDNHINSDEFERLQRKYGTATVRRYGYHENNRHFNISGCTLPTFGYCYLPITINETRATATSSMTSISSPLSSSTAALSTSSPSSSSSSSPTHARSRYTLIFKFFITAHIALNYVIGMNGIEQLFESIDITSRQFVLKSDLRPDDDDNNSNEQVNHDDSTLRTTHCSTLRSTLRISTAFTNPYLNSSSLSQSASIVTYRSATQQRQQQQHE